MKSVPTSTWAVAASSANGSDGPRLRALPPMILLDGHVDLHRKHSELTARCLSHYSAALQMARSPDDIRHIHAEGRIATLLGIADGRAIDNSINALQTYYEAGYRYMTLTRSSHTDWADCATAYPQWGGLSWTGEKIIEEMNRLGMLIDLANSAVGTIKDVLALSRAPVIFSRTGADTIHKHSCTLTDETMLQVRRCAGLFMVPFVAEVVGPNGLLIDKVADHLDHIRYHIGIEYVGLGRADNAQWLRSASNLLVYPELFAELTRRGWHHQELDLLIRGNLLRILDSVEDTATRYRQGPSAAGEGATPD